MIGLTSSSSLIFIVRILIEQLAIVPLGEAGLAPTNQFYEQCCTIKNLSPEERALLKGDKGDIGEPGVCRNNEEVSSGGSKGEKGEPGITQYLVKIVGRDAPLVTKDIFKAFLNEALKAGLKGAKGDSGGQKPAYSANEAELVVLDSDSKPIRFGVRHHGVLYDLRGNVVDE